MPNMLFANNCNTTLSSSLTNVATTMSVTSATGFPSPTGSQYFYCTLADAATQTTIEIVKVTAVSGTTFTIVRGQDGTTGTIFASGAVVSLRLVRASLNDFPKLDEDNTFAGTITFSTPLLATNMVQSTTSTSGYLSSTDWNTFNNKQPAGTYVTNLTGPITSIGNATSIASQTGTGTKFVVDNTPTLITPILGVATATSINKVAITAPATSSTLTIADGKTFTANNTLNLIGTDSTTMTFPSTSATIARNDAAQTFVGIQTLTNTLVNSGNPASIYHYDVSSNTATIGIGGTVNFSNMSGFIIANFVAYGGITVYICGGGATTALGNAGYGSPVGTLTYNPGIAGYTWTNTSGVSSTFSFFVLRTKTSA